jgi:NhaA family Na+:H+ antiporter
VAFGIMPLFALANAGVTLGSAEFGDGGSRIFFGVVLGLVAGKLLGIFAFAWLAVRLDLARLPTGVTWRGVALVGLVGGIGFTMSLFIAGLALPAGPMLETAKLAILAGSLVAVVLGLGVGFLTLKPGRAPGAAPSESEAESSTAR